MPPVAKRVEERRRRNIVPGETIATMHGAVVAPASPVGLHPIAAAWFGSVQQSGQSLFFEPSDWAAAQWVAAMMTRALTSEEVNASLVAAVWTAMGDLLTTEKSRRMAKLQVQRVIDEQPEDAKPTALDKYRKALGG